MVQNRSGHYKLVIGMDMVSIMEKLDFFSDVLSSSNVILSASKYCFNFSAMKTITKTRYHLPISYEIAIELHNSILKIIGANNRVLHV